MFDEELEPSGADQPIEFPDGVDVATPPVRITGAQREKTGIINVDQYEPSPAKEYRSYNSITKEIGVGRSGVIQITTDNSEIVIAHIDDIEWIGDVKWVAGKGWVQSENGNRIISKNNILPHGEPATGTIGIIDSDGKVTLVDFGQAGYYMFYPKLQANERGKLSSGNHGNLDVKTSGGKPVFLKTVYHRDPPRESGMPNISRIRCVR